MSDFKLEKRCVLHLEDKTWTRHCVLQILTSEDQSITEKRAVLNRKQFVALPPFPKVSVEI